MDPTERAHREDVLIGEIRQRYPYLAKWLDTHQLLTPGMPGVGGGRVIPYTIVIADPRMVRPEHHRIVHDFELRERARPIIHPDRVNVLGDNAVLVLTPPV